ncbi:MAG: trypsin-like peptidase domain-containing protein [Clostridia bacterium]|nr:trypsin-like peptidase domain-containing protein [Clostridia bacterium]
MKKTLKVAFLTVFTLVMLSLVFMVTGCGYTFSYNGIEGTEINEDGELIVYYTNGTSESLGVLQTKPGNNGGNTTINVSGSSTSVATSKAARSIVDVITDGGAGSGVIYKYNEKDDGYFIITNFHVVSYVDDFKRMFISDSIEVLLYGNEYAEGAISAKYVGGSMNYDIAVLFVKNNDIIKASSATTVTVADSNKITIGDTAIAIGNARGEGISVTSGVVSVDSETITMTAADEKTTVDFRVLRTDAPINRGNSGGGLFNENGDLIGIVNAKTIVDGVEGTGYAIPSTLAVNVADNIIDNCYGTENTSVKRALLGITVSIIDSNSVYDQENGKIFIVETIYVVEATETNLFGSSIKPNDIIKSITLDGKETLNVTRQFHVIDYLLQARVGDTGVLVVERAGNLVSLPFTITEDCIVTYN